MSTVQIKVSRLDFDKIQDERPQNNKAGPAVVDIQWCKLNKLAVNQITIN